MRRKIEREVTRSTLALVALVVLAAVTITAQAFAVSGCANNPKPDTSQLSPQGVHDLQLVQVVRGVNDVTTAAIATNRAGRLSDEYTAIVLRINKQVLDVIEANPANFKDAAAVTLKNARDGLPANIAAQIGPYLDAVRAVLDGLPARIQVAPGNAPTAEKG